MCYTTTTHDNGSITVAFGGKRIATMQAPRRAAALGATWGRGRGSRGRRFFRLDTPAGHNLGSCLAEHYPKAVEAALKA